MQLQQYASTKQATLLLRETSCCPQVYRYLEMQLTAQLYMRACKLQMLRWAFSIAAIFIWRGSRITWARTWPGQYSLLGIQELVGNGFIMDTHIMEWQTIIVAILADTRSKTQLSR
ncbi:hypothetical protein BFW89_03455 [Pseudomonas synxantha]|nr:hypothetical protein BFW89_03455 [Pseudomonas synxantha]